jgi:hypothetical protein
VEINILPGRLTMLVDGSRAERVRIRQ